jgi:zinc-binding alcohol dehydrogenase family protein
MLFDRLGVAPGKAPAGKTLLIVGASGGVGSILTQLASRLTALTVIGTASRPETQAWVKELGAHHVIDHSQPLAAQLERIGHPEVDYVVSLTHTDQHFDQLVQVIAPQGKFGLIDDPASLDVGKLKRKSVSLHWEFMFTRSLFGTDDMQAQHRLLSEVAALIDAGLIRTTMTERFGSINASNMKKAHALIESGKARGKLVLEGWGQ